MVHCPYIFSGAAKPPHRSWSAIPEYSHGLFQISPEKTETGPITETQSEHIQNCPQTMENSQKKPTRSTIVTSDYYQLYEPELVKALNLGCRLLRAGRIPDARALFLHVNRMVQSPVSNNASYDPAIIYRHLGRSYRRLEASLNDDSTGIAI